MSEDSLTRPGRLAQVLKRYEQERRQLAAQLAQVGYIWHGSVTRRKQTCGRSWCRCHREPDARHGPYAYWTTKVAGRTISRLLKPDEAALYEGWIQNRRQLERIVAALKRLSEKVAPLILGAKASVPNKEEPCDGGSDRRPPSR